MIFNMSGGGGENQELQSLDQIDVTYEMLKIIDDETLIAINVPALILHLPNNLSFTDVKFLGGCVLLNYISKETGQVNQGDFLIMLDKETNTIKINHPTGTVPVGNGTVLNDSECQILCDFEDILNIYKNKMFGKVYY